MTRQELEARRARKMALLEKVEIAIEAIAGGAQTYTFDDGQGRVMKTAADLGSLRMLMKQLEEDIAEIDAALCGGGGTHVIPGF